MTMLLQHGVTAQAEASPQATAVVYMGSLTSYGELEYESNRLAHALIEVGCRPGDRVAILMPKMPIAIVAILGALKANCCYVPVDPSEPAARLARILEVADCRCILAAGSVGPTLRRALSSVDLSRRPRIGWLDDEAVTEAESAVAFTKSDLESVPVGPIRAETTADRLAQILFTSGSTGTPKGVMIGHANVLHFIRWASAYFGIRNTDRISQHPSLRFDVSTFDVFGALWAGAELHLVPPELNILPHKLAGFIREARLTQWFSVPSVLNLMAKFDVIRDKDFPHLQRVLFAGEVLPTPTLVHWMRRLPHASFTNLYGPTETTISSSYYTIPRCPRDERKPIPIGTACDGEELLLLDDDLQPVTTPGIEADLYIRGQGVTGGYWRDPDRTRKAFLPCGEDGNDTMYRTGDRARRDAEGLFYFVGRADRQIKSRGYRVELNEIESALHTISELREGVVVAIESSGFESVLICCAYAPQPDCTLSLREIRGRLSRLVPAYMIPARWKSYDLVPKNSNGKFDRLLIAEHFRNAERGLVESELASAIQQPTASTA